MKVFTKLILLFRLREIQAYNYPNWRCHTCANQSSLLLQILHIIFNSFWKYANGKVFHIILQPLHHLPLLFLVVIFATFSEIHKCGQFSWERSRWKGIPLSFQLLSWIMISSILEICYMIQQIYSLPFLEIQHEENESTDNCRRWCLFRFYWVASYIFHFHLRIYFWCPWGASIIHEKMHGW